VGQKGQMMGLVDRRQPPRLPLPCPWGFDYDHALPDRLQMNLSASCAPSSALLQRVKARARVSAATPLLSLVRVLYSNDPACVLIKSLVMRIIKLNSFFQFTWALCRTEEMTFIFPLISPSRVTYLEQCKIYAIHRFRIR